ncbi:hypothetical protein [Psychroflexus aestuariivivens]|uniref:hypothetical protein n=1 Tax=Psychroflexus aestuariivivens TaxID=1795040 RepID=UPI000FD6D4FC|nr:hypothetical protein [Psychroflexus aestuariivivens]
MSSVIVGIDPGVDTGVGLCFSNKDKDALTLPIHKAFNLINHLVNTNEKVYVRVEDARKRKWFGKNSNSKQQGAGSIKRDCKIWEDFLTEVKKDHPGKFNFQMIHPVKGATKLNSKTFNQITGITKRTSNHARDAYMLVHGLNPKLIR